jgi:hypothetical protein
MGCVPHIGEIKNVYKVFVGRPVQILWMDGRITHDGL